MTSRETATDCNARNSCGVCPAPCLNSMYNTHIVGVVVVGDLAVGLVEVKVGEGNPRIVLTGTIVAGAAGSRARAAVSRHVVDDSINVDAANNDDIVL